MQKELLTPKYAQEFMCIGPKCPDDCCHGWSVSVDPATFFSYNTHPELSKLVQPFLKINQNLTTKEHTPAYIKQKPNRGPCELQAANGLCKIHSQFGANALSSTCAVYPRNFSALGSEQLMVMNESCPEVARKLIEDPNALELDLAPLEVWDRLILKDQTEFNSDYQRRFQLLQGLLTLLRHREINLEMRIFIATLLIQRAEKLLEEGDASELSMNDLLAMFSDLVNQDYFEKQVMLMKDQPKSGLPLVILESLLVVKQKDEAFNQDLGKVLLGLNIHTKQDINTSALNRLEAARQQYLGDLEKAHPWMLENILVNWLLFSLFPINKQRISDGWLNLTTRYLLLRSILSGVGAFQQKLTTEDAINLTYRFGRRVGSSSILHKLQLDLVGRNLNQPAALVYALNL